MESCSLANQEKALSALRLMTVLALIALPAATLANAAMPYALQMFDYRPWIVYVIAMIVIEVIMIGRSIGVSWLKSFAIAIVANLFTAFLCPECCAPLLHSSGIAPNPLLDTFWLFLSFGIFSALAEGVIWGMATRKQFPTAAPLRRSLLAHLVGVPLAMAILLVPSRPYIGMQLYAGAARRFDLMAMLTGPFQQEVLKDNQFPTVSSAEDLVKRYTVEDKQYRWEIAYIPDFSRFDTGEARRYPYEWNRSLNGAKLSVIDQATQPAWILRAKEPDGSVIGFTWFAEVNKVQLSHDPASLGYSTSHSN